MILALTLLLLTVLCCTSALAAGGDVAGAVEQTWKEAATQIKSVVEKVVFPALDMILAIAFFVKLGGAYFDFRQRGQFEWTGPAILFACLPAGNTPYFAERIRGSPEPESPARPVC